MIYFCCASSHTWREVVTDAIYQLQVHDGLVKFLNQAHANHRWCAPGFLVLFLSANVCMCVFVCVCPPPRQLITSGVMRCDI